MNLKVIILTTGRQSQNFEDSPNRRRQDYSKRYTNHEPRTKDLCLQIEPHQVLRSLQLQPKENRYVRLYGGPDHPLQLLKGQFIHEIDNRPEHLPLGTVPDAGDPDPYHDRHSDHLN